MKLSMTPQQGFLLEGSGKEFRIIASQLLRTSHEESSHIDNPDIIEFYQSLLQSSNIDTTNSIQIRTTAMVLNWMFKCMRVISKMKENGVDLLRDLEYQFHLLQGVKKENNISLKDRLLLDYQHILGLSNIKKMTAFIESFQLTEDELQKMVLTSFLETYPSIKTKDIRIDMLERMYHHFFNQYESLLIETHLLYSYPLFREQLIRFYQEEPQVQEDWNDSSYLIGAYLLYFDMFLKGLEDGFVYQAEDEAMVFDWFKPLFIRVALQRKEENQRGERTEVNQEKDMMTFREIYIQELSKSFPDIERIENDQENPYNVVFVLKGKRKVVCNTLKHYEWYVQEELKGYGKERVKSMEEFIQKIAPPQKNTSTTDLFQKSFEEVKEDIYPMIRLISSTPQEAIYKPFKNDIGIYYGVRIQADGKTQYAIIMKRLIEKWGISVDVLNQTALTNLQQKKPSFVTYYEVLKKQLTVKQLQQIPRAYKELYMYAGKSAIDSSYLLDKEIMTSLKETLKTDTLIVSMPVRDCLLVTKKEHFPLLQKISHQLYQSHPAKLLPDIWIESEGEWT